jgi:hypothetical protein
MVAIIRDELPAATERPSKSEPHISLHPLVDWARLSKYF